MKTITLESDQHWHELRKLHVGGSEIAALFGEHPQCSRFELFARKKGLIQELSLPENERMFWGTILEPAIAEGVRQKTGWNIRKVRRYYSGLPELGLGGSLDHEIVGHDRGPGVLEIKTADWLIARGWKEDGPPLSYELQVQGYMACTGRSWGVMAVLVGGNELRLYEYERRETTIEIIKREVALFWQSVDENKPPMPDWARDSDTISAIYNISIEGRTIDLTSSNRAPELINAYRAAAAAEKAAGLEKDAAKAELLPLIGDAETAICGPYKISCKMVPSAPIAYVRKEYRGWRITEPSAKGKASAAAK